MFYGCAAPLYCSYAISAAGMLMICISEPCARYGKFITITLAKVLKFYYFCNQKFALNGKTGI